MIMTEKMAESSGVFFFSSRRRHTRCSRDWSSDVCSSDLVERDTASALQEIVVESVFQQRPQGDAAEVRLEREAIGIGVSARSAGELALIQIDRKSVV